jgi:hypothetical protein
LTSCTPQAEHTWLVGSNRPILANVRPYRAIFSSMHRSSCDQLASDTDLASRVRLIPHPQAVVVDHPGAAEHSGQRLLLPRRRVDAIPVPDLHDTTACHPPMTFQADYGRGRQLVSAYAPA